MLLKRAFLVLVPIALISLSVACGAAVFNQPPSAATRAPSPASPTATPTLEPAILVFSPSPELEPTAKEISLPGYPKSTTDPIKPLFRQNGITRVIPDLNGLSGNVEELPVGTSTLKETITVSNPGKFPANGIYRLHVRILKLKPLDLGGIATFGTSGNPEEAVYHHFRPGPVLAPGVSWPYTNEVSLPGCGIYEQTFSTTIWPSDEEQVLNRTYLAVPDPSTPNCDFAAVLAKVPQQQ